jgi:hypothetical protein
MAALNQRWIVNATTGWIQLASAVKYNGGVVPVPACLTSQYTFDRFGGSTMELLRAPCEGGNATGLNPIVPISQLSPFQQWSVGSGQEGQSTGTIANVVEDETEVSWCIGISLASAHWTRASEPSKPSASGKSSYVSVRHHPDTCLACHPKSAQGVSQTCDNNTFDGVPIVTRCQNSQGAADAGAGIDSRTEPTIVLVEKVDAVTGKKRVRATISTKKKARLRQPAMERAADISDSGSDIDSGSDGIGGSSSSAISWKYELAPKLPASTTATCIMGLNLAGSDMPGMPVHYLSAAACQAQCARLKSCRSYVFQGKGYEARTEAACYLKTSNSTIAEHAEVYDH